MCSITARPLSLLLLAALVALLASSSHAATLFVPGTYPTIQAAIDDAANGDVIEVSPGWYPEAIDFLGKSIHVLAVGGSDATTLDGIGQLTSVVTFRSGETPSTILEGFTIINGAGTVDDFCGCAYGVGINVINASPTIRHCFFMANGIDSVFGLPTRGGGMAVRNGNPIIHHSTFHENLATTGGAIYAGEESSPKLFDVRFEYNVAEDSGGAISIADGAHPEILSCVFESNFAPEGKGGALMVAGTADGTDASAGFMVNSLIYDNGAAEGGALFHEGGIFTLTNCTVTDNDAAISPGLRCNGTFVQNCIVWVNGPGPEITGPNADVSFSCVTGGFAGVGNIAAAPLFNPNYTVPAGSPVIDAGNSLVSIDVTAATGIDLPPFDLASAPRLLDAPVPGTGVGPGPVDMGCFEAPGVVVAPAMTRGDPNGDGSVNIADAVVILGHLFDGEVLACQSAADANDDGMLNIADAVHTLSFLFDGSTEMPAPYPDCGFDETSDDLTCEESPCDP